MPEEIKMDKETNIFIYTIKYITIIKLLVHVLYNIS